LYSHSGIVTVEPGGERIEIEIAIEIGIEFRGILTLGIFLTPIALAVQSTGHYGNRIQALAHSISISIPISI
ncbi:MAG: hypothetical protein MUP26_06790, partial [Desulfobulbaceae bacterium]|nr:hypothetical protein [Desulfobulbaceae bacterium]